MLTTLRATVQGDRIRWHEHSEGVFPRSRPVPVLITPLEEPPGAATAQAHGATLVTHNPDDFKWIAGLGLLDPFAAGPAS